MGCQLFVHPLSFDTGTTDNTSQQFEYIKQCFHVIDLILLPESTLCKRGEEGYQLTPPPPSPSLVRTDTNTCACILPSHCSYIMASHVAGLAVMKCEASVTPQGSYRVELYSLFQCTTLNFLQHRYIFSNIWLSLYFLQAKFKLTFIKHP